MSLKNLIDLTRTAAQGAANLARFKGIDFPDGDGCIRITIFPLTNEFDEFCGGMGCEYEYNFPLTPGGSHVIDDNGVSVNCYAFSALKTATCARVREKDGADRASSAGFSKLPQEDIDKMTPENGYACYSGAVCATIRGATTNAPKQARVFICVSGGKSENDAVVATMAMDAFISNLRRQSDNKFHIDEKGAAMR